MNYDAKIVIRAFVPPADMQDMVGICPSGWIFEDTKQEGNHPFPDGKYVDITRIQSVHEEESAVYIVTKNTTYLCVGFARDVSALAKQTILGDPVE